MIERIVFRGDNPLPAYYEVTMRSQSNETIPEETAIIHAGMLDDSVAGSEFTREDVVYHAARAYGEEHDTPVSYSMRLMRPAETRKYLRPFLRAAMYKMAMDRVVATLPAGLLGDDGSDFQTALATVEALGRGF